MRSSARLLFTSHQSPKRRLSDKRQARGGKMSGCQILRVLDRFLTQNITLGVLRCERFVGRRDGGTSPEAPVSAWLTKCVGVSGPVSKFDRSVATLDRSTTALCTIVPDAQEAWLSLLTIMYQPSNACVPSRL